MRAGIFTDGGKRQHEAAEKARKRLEAKLGKRPPPTDPIVVDEPEML